MKKPGSAVLFRYIAREYLFSFLVAFLFFFFLFFINQMLVIARDVLSKRVDVIKTILLIVYATPAIIALAFPFASLVGSLMAIGRFSSDNEVIAMQACGISILRIFIPILIIALIVAGASFIMNDYFLPLGTINYVKLYQELIFSNSELILEPYAITRFNNSSIVTDSVQRGTLGRLLILDSDEQGRQRVISAESGKLAKNDTQLGLVSLELKDVEVINVSNNKVNYDTSDSEEIVYNILLKNLTFGLHNPGPREMSSPDVYDRILVMSEALDVTKESKNQELSFLQSNFDETYEKETSSRIENRENIETVLARLEPMRREYQKIAEEPLIDRNLQLYWIEFWKKFSIPAACFTLVFLGFPSGMFAKRSGRSIGFGVGFIIAVIFWSMLLAGQTLGMENPLWSPFLLMWAPNILFLGLGIYLLARRILR